MIIFLVTLATSLLVWALIHTLREAFIQFESKYSEAGQAHLDALYLSLDPRQLTKLSICCGTLAAFLAYLLAEILGALIVGILGLFAPLIVLGWLKKRRQSRFNEQLIDALNNMGNCLKAGFSLPQAIELIGREMDDPIGMEFRITQAEMRLGKPPMEALKSMCQRVQVTDLDLVVNAMNLSEDVGGNLTEVFENISHTIRERFRVEGRIQSLSAMGRLQGIVLILMPFALVFFMSRFQPEFIAPLLETTAGQIASGIGLIWLAIGWLSIRKIVTIDV